MESPSCLTKCRLFNILLYLTSLLLTECQSTAVPNISSNTYSNSCYSLLIIHLGVWLFIVVSFTPLLFYPQTNLIELFMDSCFYLHPFVTEKPLAPLWYRTKFARCSILQPCHCIKVATVEQQQRTDCLDISNSVDSAGEFMVSAAATAVVLFCLGFWIYYS